MKKNMYSVSEAVSYRTSFTIPEKSDFSSPCEPGANRYRYPPPVSNALHVCEEVSSFQVKLAKEDLVRYQESFLKKKMLHIWRRQRPCVKREDPLFAYFEFTIYQVIYQELKPFLSAAYAEDFKLPLTSFTFFSWLQYIKLVAQVLRKSEEAGDWEEIRQFFHHCMQYRLLHDLFEIAF